MRNIKTIDHREENMMESKIEKITDSINWVRECTNNYAKQDKVKKRIDVILKSIPGSQALFVSIPSCSMEAGEYKILLDPGIGQKFEVCKFDLWINDLSRYSDDYILDRIIKGLEIIEKHIAEIYNNQLAQNLKKWEK